MHSIIFFDRVQFSTRLRALRDMLESVARAEDIVKVHEARLTEKETTSLSLNEVEDYILTLTVYFHTFLAKIAAVYFIEKWEFLM